MNTPTKDILELICDAHWNNNGQHNGITFHDIYQHNACNHTLSGTIDINGTLYGFVIDNGDRDGTVVHKWGLADDVGIYKHPEPTEPLTFVPKNINLKTERPGMWKVYLSWIKQDWFIKKEQAYLYDRHFQPGAFVEKHYRDWADQKGLVVGFLSDYK
jgi:hypothetical protein